MKQCEGKIPTDWKMF